MVQFDLEGIGPGFRCRKVSQLTDKSLGALSDSLLMGSGHSLKKLFSD